VPYRWTVVAARTILGLVLANSVEALDQSIQNPGRMLCTGAGMGSLPL
jgi:hypothetical protein